MGQRNNRHTLFPRNRISALPAALGQVTTLQRLDLSYNPVEACALARQPHRRYPPANMAKRAFVWCGLQVVPSSVGMLMRLTMMNLDSCYPLRHISEAAMQGIGVSLVELHIAYCRQLHEIPDAVAYLTRQV
jgi:hypothetical protein